MKYVILKHLYQKKHIDNDIRRKRQQLSVSATRTVSKHYVSFVVDFGMNQNELKA